MNIKIIESESKRNFEEEIEEVTKNKNYVSLGLLEI